MKSIVFMRLFTWAAQAESIKQASPRPPGYWPIESAVSHQAVMPVINRELVADKQEHPESLAHNPGKELILAGLAGAVAVAPSMLLTIF